MSRVGVYLTGRLFEQSINRGITILLTKLVISVVWYNFLLGLVKNPAKRSIFLSLYYDFRVINTSVHVLQNMVMIHKLPKFQFRRQRCVFRTTSDKYFGQNFAEFFCLFPNFGGFV